MLRLCPLRQLAPLLCGMAFAVGAASLTAQEPSPRPTLEARRFVVSPVVDGDVRGEAVWQELPAATGFTQTEPDVGLAATEKTEVRIGFDDTTLFVGVVLFDSEPETLTVSDSRRDARLGNEDSIQIIFDSLYDQQNGFVFGTNVAGIQHDGQVTNEGRGSSGRRRRSGGFNLDWDTSWEVRVERGEYGWSAEFAIPFRSLRYGGGRGPWGVNFQRNIRRKNEEAYWAELGPQFDLYRVSQAGTLTGLEPPKQRNLKLLPYVLAEARDEHDQDLDEEFDAGIDVKYGVTPSLTLDLTVNTDFAQVEVDEQQVNLDRFSLFFPEKRPFFLENAGFLSVGNSGEVDLFFSRRIGLDSGQVVPILGGVRLSGRAAGLNVGFLNMQTDELVTDDVSVQSNSWTVARLSKEYPNRSRIGMLVTNRVGSGSLAPEDDENQVFAVDGQIGIGRYAEVSGWASKSDTPGLAGRDRAFDLRGSYSSPDWRWRANYTAVGNEFNPEVGFVSRRNYRNFGGFIMRRFRPTGSKHIKEWGPRFFGDSYWDYEDFQETGIYSFGGELELRSGMRMSFSAGGRTEGLQEPFTIFDDIVIPAATYDTNGIFIFFNTNRGRPVSFFTRVQSGGFFDGRQFSVSPSLDFRFGESLSSRIEWSYNEIDLEGGAFETNLGSLRVTYAFSTSLLLQALIQYNDVNDDVSTNLRFSWLQRANTGLFVVYNEVREFGTLALPQPDRSLIVKYSRLFDVFR